MSDALPDILAHVRKRLPDVPPSVWREIELAIRADLGADRHYIAKQPKRLLLEALSDANTAADCARLSNALGVSVRRVQQLRKLK